MKIFTFLFIFLSFFLAITPCSAFGNTNTFLLPRYEDKNNILHNRSKSDVNIPLSYTKHFNGAIVDATKRNNIIKKIIELADKIILVIIFLFWVGITIKRAFHNYFIKKKYGRDNNKYEVKRNKDEGVRNDRHTIYIVSKEKNNENKFEYHHIINTYTMVKLGYTRPSRNGEYCFSAKVGDYKLGENIYIYNITFDFRKIDS